MLIHIRELRIPILNIKYFLQFFFYIFVYGRCANFLEYEKNLIFCEYLITSDCN